MPPFECSSAYKLSEPSVHTSAQLFRDSEFVENSSFNSAKISSPVGITSSGSSWFLQQWRACVRSCPKLETSIDSPSWIANLRASLSNSYSCSRLAPLICHVRSRTAPSDGDMNSSSSAYSLPRNISVVSVATDVTVAPRLHESLKRRICVQYLLRYLSTGTGLSVSSRGKLDFFLNSSQFLAIYLFTFTDFILSFASIWGNQTLWGLFAFDSGISRYMFKICSHC